MQVKRMIDVRRARIPESIGYCQADQGPLLDVVNEAQERLMYAGGEVGWWGSWMKMVFNVDGVNNPYITLPRTVDRLINLDYCRRPIRIQNEFYEFLEAGIGLQPKTNCFNTALGNCQLGETYDRGLYPTMLDLVPGGKRLRFYITDASDIGRRVLVQGNDGNGTNIVSLDGTFQVQGIFLAFTQPFVDTPFDISFLSGLQKDVTIGLVKVYEVDMASGTQRLLSTMDPAEEVAGYRRYFLNGLPRNCCNPPGTTDNAIVQVTAMAKLAFIPVIADTDYLYIQNIPALKEECQAVRYGENDDSTSMKQEVARHAKAINLLNGELRHHLGKDQPAVNFAPWGTAHLQRQRIGNLF